jgi:hypothetical protein
MASGSVRFLASVIVTNRNQNHDFVGVCGKSLFSIEIERETRVSHDFPPFSAYLPSGSGGLFPSRTYRP